MRSGLWLIFGIIALPSLAADEISWPGIRRDAEVSVQEFRMFPSRVQEIVAGGGGRFLIVKMPSLYSVAVFDVNSLKIVKYIRLRNPR